MKEYKVIVYTERTNWYNLEGQLHREDGPAIEFADGYKVWFLNEQCHRDDGPAIEKPNGDKEWYLNGQKLTEEQFNQRTQTTEVTLGQIAEKFGIDVSQLKIKK